MSKANRRDRGELPHARDQVSAQVRFAYALGDSAEAKVQTEALKRIDRHLSTTESALDRVLDRTVQTSERSNQRRTKQTTLEMARERQTLVGEALRRQKVPSMGTRIDLRRPRFEIVEGAKQGFVLIAVKRRR